MDRCIGEWKGQMDGKWIDGQMNRWKDEKMERWIDAQVDGKDRWMERIDGWKGQIDRKIERMEGKK